jgi:hypothetical protein
VRATIVLDAVAVDGRGPLVAEVLSVVGPGGEKLDVAAFACPSRQVAAHHLGREPEGLPLFVYTRDPEEGR